MKKDSVLNLGGKLKSYSKENQVRYGTENPNHMVPPPPWDSNRGPRGWRRGKIPLRQRVSLMLYGKICGRVYQSMHTLQQFRITSVSKVIFLCWLYFYNTKKTIAWQQRFIKQTLCNSSWIKVTWKSTSNNNKYNYFNTYFEGQYQYKVRKSNDIYNSEVLNFNQSLKKETMNKTAIKQIGSS